jgi:hypothetical protein
MASLSIDFQEGFTGEAVIVEVNGKEVFRQEEVKTKRMLGLATSFEAQLPERGLHVKVILPNRNASKSIELRGKESYYLGVSVNEGKIEFTIFDKPMGYA